MTTGREVSGQFRFLGGFQSMWHHLSAVMAGLDPATQLPRALRTIIWNRGDDGGGKARFPPLSPHGPANNPDCRNSVGLTSNARRNALAK